MVRVIKGILFWQVSIKGGGGVREHIFKAVYNYSLYGMYFILCYLLLYIHRIYICLMTDRLTQSVKCIT